MSKDEVNDDIISRRAAIDALGERPMVWMNSDYEIAQRNQYDMDKLAIETVPSAQPEIIRCKDCKYHDERYRRISVKWLPCMEIRTDGNWFCASAERREE